MATFKACKLTVNGIPYVITSDRVVLRRVDVDGTFTAVDVLRPKSVQALGPFDIVCPEVAANVIAEAQRQRRNRASRERYDAMRSIGMVKTPYGWE